MIWRDTIRSLVHILVAVIGVLVLIYACTDDPTPDTRFNDYCCEQDGYDPVEDGW